METKKAVFKPLNGLTTWVNILTGSKIGAGALMLLLYTATALIPLEGDTYVLLIGVTSLFMLAYAGLFLVAGILSLFWIYGAARNAKALRPEGFETSPGWAVGWFFVPFANLYKPYEVVRDIWIASKGKDGDRYAAKVPKAIFWWWTGLIGGFTTRITEKMGALSTLEDNGEFLYDGLELVYMGGTLVAIISTTAFLLMVREIHRFQLRNATQLAETF